MRTLLVLGETLMFLPISPAVSWGKGRAITVPDFF